MKKVIKYVIIYFSLICIFCLLLTLTSLIPKKYIETKTNESEKILADQTNSWFVRIPSKQIGLKFDNYTDALMINTAYSINEKTPFYSAMVARKNYIEGKEQIIYPDTKRRIKIIFKI